VKTVLSSHKSSGVGGVSGRHCVLKITVSVRGEPLAERRLLNGLLPLVSKLGTSGYVANSSVVVQVVKAGCSQSLRTISRQISRQIRPEPSVLSAYENCAATRLLCIFSESLLQLCGKESARSNTLLLCWLSDSSHSCLSDGRPAQQFGDRCSTLNESLTNGCILKS